MNLEIVPEEKAMVLAKLEAEVPAILVAELAEKTQTMRGQEKCRR